MTPTSSRNRLLVAMLAAVPFALVACGGSASTSTSSTAAAAITTTATARAGETITMLVYDAFTEPEVLKSFTQQTGITVRIAKGGDTGTLVNKAILTAGNPEGDVLWGLDNTLLSRALETDGLFVPYASGELASLERPGVGRENAGHAAPLRPAQAPEDGVGRVFVDDQHRRAELFKGLPKFEGRPDGSQSFAPEWRKGVELGAPLRCRGGFLPGV